MSTEPGAARGQIEAIIETARDLFGLSGSSWEQFRRYATEHLCWCEEHGIDVPASAAARAQYRAHLEASGKVTQARHWTLRATAINKLPAVITELRRQAKVACLPRRTRLIDALPEHSTLRRGIDAALGNATGGYRASLRADVALVLEWCVQNTIDPVVLGPKELAMLEHWLRFSGRKSRGPLFAARRLHRAFHRPVVWWR